uniref:Uncharacterized protein n=1 Tax=Romanomermis culicivorax TaxID=13658 RepID=A0A915HL63_ROMCU
MEVGTSAQADPKIHCDNKFAKTMPNTQYSSTGETLFESHAVKAVDDPELVGLESSAKSKSISASSSIFIK